MLFITIRGFQKNIPRPPPSFSNSITEGGGGWGPVGGGGSILYPPPLSILYPPPPSVGSIRQHGDIYCPHRHHLLCWFLASIIIYAGYDNPTIVPLKEKRESFWPKKLSLLVKVKFDHWFRVIGEYLSQIDTILRVKLTLNVVPPVQFYQWLNFLRQNDSISIGDIGPLFPLTKYYCITGRANPIFCAVGLR